MRTTVLIALISCPLVAGSVAADEIYATSITNVPVSGDTITSSFLVAGEPGTDGNATIVEGQLVTNEFGGFPVLVRLDSSLIDEFNFPETANIVAGGTEISLDTQQFATGEPRLTRYLIQVGSNASEPTYSVAVVDDPAWWVGLVVLAAIPYAACGATYVWEQVGKCDPGSTVEFGLGIASCSVTCGDR